MNRHCILVRRTPWSLGGSPAHLRPSGLVWSGDDKLCAGDVETPLKEKLLSGTRDQSDRGLDVLGRDLIAEKQYYL